MTRRTWWLTYDDGGKTGPYWDYERALRDAGESGCIVTEELLSEEDIPAGCPTSRIKDETTQGTIMSNADRAMNAERALVFYSDMKNSEGPLQTDALDLLTDLMHWCDRRGVDFDSLLEVSRIHFTEEQDND